MTSTIPERVARGGQWLDEHEPGWFDRVDLTTLRLESECKCTLGQLYAARARDAGRENGYAFAFEHLFDARDTVVTELGFDQSSGFGQRLGDWILLTEEWKRVITARRLAAQEPRAGNIGEPLREVEFEPLPETAPIQEPSPAPAPAPAPEPAREPVKEPAPV